MEPAGDDGEINPVRAGADPGARRCGAIWDLEQVRGEGAAEVWRLASAQRGHVVRGQLLEAGINRGAIEHRLAAGSLVIVYRGVYRVGHSAPVPWDAEMAAALYFGGDAVLSHRSAAAIWGLTGQAPSEPQLTIVGRDARSRPGRRVTRAQALAPADFRRPGGLPVTAPARTVIDLSGDAGESELHGALAKLRVLGLAGDRDLRAAMARAPRRRGVARLTEALEASGGTRPTRSEAERRLLALVTQAQLPAPEVNFVLHGYMVDALWRRERLVVEVDGHAFHGHRTAFERDRLRDQVLAAHGYHVIRVTWRQLVREPLAVAVRIGQALVLAEQGRGPV